MAFEIAKADRIMHQMFIYENYEYGKWKLVNYLITLIFEAKYLKGLFIM